MKKFVKFDRLRLYSHILFAALITLYLTPAQALNSGTLRLTTYNGWQAFEVISQGDDVPGDGFSHSMPSTFDGLGAWLPNASTLRVHVNHEITGASISEVDMDLANLQTAINNVISSGNTGGVGFVLSARQAYGRWSSDGGLSWINTSSGSDTSFSRFCSGQSYMAHTYGLDRGFVDPIYITGEEVGSGRLFALNSATRDLYQLSGITGSASGGIGGMPIDSWENAALLDTGETAHVALLLSPDGGSLALKLYIGEKGKDVNGNTSTSFLARNGLAHGSWYYLNGLLPGNVGTTNGGTFDTSSSGALAATKMEDIDTSPSNPTQVVLGNQNSGVFTFDFDLVFAGAFNAGASSLTVTKISDSAGGSNSLNNPDNLDWIAATILGGNWYPEGLIFVNEDNNTGEIWQLNPDGSNQVKVGQTTVGSESTGILDLSELVGYVPGSILIVNNQGTPSSLSVLINPDAELTNAECGNAFCEIGETPANCPQDCPEVQIDTDNDGIPDAQDNCPTIANTDQLNNDGDVNGDACDNDDDNDGLSDTFELSINTNPFNIDTDGDSVNDFDEVNYDGLPAYDVNYDMNPLSNNTDNDAYLDGADTLPINFNYEDGDVAPYGNPNATVDAADLLVGLQLVLGTKQITDLEKAHMDLYPPGAPDGEITLSDFILQKKLVW